jgi:hypothetical protein
LLNEKQEHDVKNRIRSEGRSPTLIAECSEGHELLITLYFRGSELAVRDVIVAYKAGLDENNSKVSKSEIDWVRHAFGGGN